MAEPVKIYVEHSLGVSLETSRIQTRHPPHGLRRRGWPSVGRRSSDGCRNRRGVGVDGRARSSSRVRSEPAQRRPHGLRIRPADRAYGVKYTLRDCYRQKEALGRAARRVMVQVAESSPYLKAESTGRPRRAQCRQPHCERRQVSEGDIWLRTDIRQRPARRPPRRCADSCSNRSGNTRSRCCWCWTMPVRQRHGRGRLSFEGSLTTRSTCPTRVWQELARREKGLNTRLFSSPSAPASSDSSRMASREVAAAGIDAAVSYASRSHGPRTLWSHSLPNARALSFFMHRFEPPNSHQFQGVGGASH